MKKIKLPRKRKKAFIKFYNRLGGKGVGSEMYSYFITDVVQHWGNKFIKHVPEEHYHSDKVSKLPVVYW